MKKEDMEIGEYLDSIKVYGEQKSGDFSGTLDALVGGISVLQEAVEKLLASDPQIAGTTDEELEEAVQNGYDPQIRIQAEAILIARNALRMTGSLNPSND